MRFQRWFFEKFSGGIAPRPPYWGRATAPLPRPNPLGAPALRASRASLFGPSIVRRREVFAPPTANTSGSATGLRRVWWTENISSITCITFPVYYKGAPNYTAQLILHKVSKWNKKFTQPYSQNAQHNTKELQEVPCSVKSANKLKQESTVWIRRSNMVLPVFYFNHFRSRFRSRSRKQH